MNSSSSSKDSGLFDFENKDSKLTKILFIIEHIFRTFSVILHLIYFNHVRKHKTLRNNNLLYLHHVNAISFLFCLHYVLYFTSQRPSTLSDKLNECLCLVSEAAWAMLKFLRCFVILKLAVYQYLATFKINVYRSISISKTKLLIPVFFLWICSVTFHLCTKFSMGTGPSPIFCYDGYSTNIKNVIITYVICSMINTFIPVVTVAFLYYCITRRLKLLAIRSHRVQRPRMSPNEPGAENECCITCLYDATNKFLLMNLAVLLSSIAILVLGICLDANYRNIDLLCLLRILTIIFQSFIPVLSMYCVRSSLTREYRRRAVLAAASNRHHTRAHIFTSML